MVGMREWPLLRFDVLEKKKLAASNPFSLHSSPIVCASADFPAPALPCILIIDDFGLLSSAHAITSLMTDTRVAGLHLAGSMRSLESSCADIMACWRRMWSPSFNDQLAVIYIAGRGQYHFVSMLFLRCCVRWLYCYSSQSYHRPC